MASAWDNPAKAAGNTVLSADYNSLVKYVKPFQSNGLYYGTPMSDHDYYGTYTDGKSGEAITVMQVVYLKQSDNKWYKAKADYTSTLTGMLGLAVSAAGGADTQFTVLLYGIYRDDSFTAFTAGTDVYVSAATAGSVTQTLGTSGTILVRRIGYAQDTKILVFDPETNIHTEVLHTGVYFGTGAPATVISQDNNGVERKFYKNDFSINDSSQWAAQGGYGSVGDWTWDTANKKLTVSTTDTTEKRIYQQNKLFGSGYGNVLYTCNIRIDSADADNTHIRYGYFIIKYVDSSNRIQVYFTRQNDATAGELRLYKVVGGVSTQVGSTYSVADATGWHRITATFNHTTGGAVVYFDGVSRVTGTISDSVLLAEGYIMARAWTAGTTPITVEFSDLTFNPSIAYTDTFSSDTSRYVQVTGTVAFNTDHLDLTAADGAYVRERLISYQFGRGSRLKKMTLPASCTTGDYINIKLCANGDMLRGYGVGVIRQADTTWHICTVKDVTVTDTGTEVSGLADGDSFYVEAEWEPDYGIIYAYVYESTKPSEPQVKIFDATYNFGFTGVVAFAAAGGGSKVFQLNSVTIRANNIIARSNVPAYGDRIYMKEDFSADRNLRWQARYGTWTWDGATKVTGVSTGTSAVYRFKPVMFTNQNVAQTFTFCIKNIETTAESKSIRALINWDGTMNTASSQSNGYDVYFRPHCNTSTPDTIQIYRRVQGVATALCSSTACSIPDNTIIYCKIVVNTDGTISVYCDTTDGTTFIVTSTAESITPRKYGYFGIETYSASSGLAQLEFSNLVISGNVFNFKPIMRGAQIGEYYNGSTTVTCSRFTDDCNSDTHLEYTLGSGTLTQNLTEGYFKMNGVAASDRYVHSNGIKSAAGGTNGRISFDFYVETPSGGETYFRCYALNFDFWIRISTPRLYTYTTADYISLPSTMAYDTWYNIEIVTVGTTIYCFLDGLFIDSKVTTASSSARDLIYRFGSYNQTDASAVRWKNLVVDWVEPFATNGSMVTIGGISHGARGALWDGTFDGYEYAYMDNVAFPVPEGEYYAGLYCITTYGSSTKYVRDRVNNYTDSTSLSVESSDYSSNGVAIVPTTSWGVAGRKRVAFTEEHANDTIRIGAWRDMSAVAIESQPCTFINGVQFRKRS